MFWLDLECSGSGDDEEVLELGAIITDRELNELESRSIVFNATQEKFDGMVKVVVDMHTKNKLIDEISIVSQTQKDTELAKADLELAAWIRTFVGGDHIVFAGSGVSHYDRKFIKRDFPLLDDRLTHFAVDVGSIRRGMEYAGVKWGEDFYDKTHRALDDARQHKNEFKRFVKWCNDAVSLGSDFQL